MTKSAFRVAQYVIPGQHIREYPDSIRGRQEDVLRIAVKHYVPLQTPEPAPENSITIIGSHANGFPKETYEPFMAELCSRLQSQGVYIRGIWMADSCHQGASAIHNENILGDTTNWFDHARDLLLMVNHFRSEMPRPLIGFGHSFACAQIIHLSMMHPRLLSTLIMCEPVMFNGVLDIKNPALPSTRRRDIWETRSKAETALRKGFRSWDARALEQYITYGLRSVPTLLYDPERDLNINEDAVTLTTTKHQEAWTFDQLNYEAPDEEHDRILRPDQDPDIHLTKWIVRPECQITMSYLPNLRPSVFYIFGGKSNLSTPKMQDEKMRMTGIDIGGSGGAAIGKVKKVVFKNAGHLLAFELLTEIAEVSAKWVQEWFDQWLKEEKVIEEHENLSSDKSGLRVSKQWVEATKYTIDTPRPLKPKI